LEGQFIKVPAQFYIDFIRFAKIKNHLTILQNKGLVTVKILGEIARANKEFGELKNKQKLGSFFTKCFNL